MPKEIKTDDLAHFSGLLPLADPTIALDFLLAAKNGVRNCAIALTESATPEVRATVRQLLDESILMHEQISQLMINKGWVHPYNVNEQFKLDLTSAQLVQRIAGLELFPPMPPPDAPGNRMQKEVNEV